MNTRLIQQIPLEELVTDLIDSARDLGECQLAIKAFPETKHLPNLYLQERIDGNQEIIKKIEREIKRRFGVFCS